MERKSLLGIDVDRSTTYLKRRSAIGGVEKSIDRTKRVMAVQQRNLFRDLSREAGFIKDPTEKDAYWAGVDMAYNLPQDSVKRYKISKEEIASTRTYLEFNTTECEGDIITNIGWVENELEQDSQDGFNLFCDVIADLSEREGEVASEAMAEGFIRVILPLLCSAQKRQLHQDLEESFGFK